MSTKEISLVNDSWLTHLLGMNCYKVEVPSISDYLDSRAKMSSISNSFLTIKTESAYLSETEYENGDIKFIQVMNQLKWNPEEINPKFGSFRIRETKSGDVPAILSIAENSFIHSRFHADQRFSLETAEEIKKKWLVANLTERSGCKNFILVEYTGKPVGFLSLLLLGDHISIDLISVFKQYRGRGLGKFLITFGQQLAWESKLPIIVGTQENNPANLLYLQMGFHLLKKVDVWHDLRNTQNHLI
jgi:GNAT superfamily N-acetyltransferase